MGETLRFEAPAYERLLSQQEAIDFLGLDSRPNPQGALRWLLRTRKLAHVKLGRGIIGFRRDDLAALVERQRIPAEAEKAPKRGPAP